MSQEEKIAKQILAEIDGDKTREKILELWEQGLLNSDFRQYAENAANGLERSSLEPFLWKALLLECFRHKYIPPKIPDYLLKDYKARIEKALNPPNINVVDQMLNKLSEEGLLTQAFGELFLIALNEIATQGEALFAESSWEMCRERLDLEILDRIDELFA